ncbi:alpha/beta hydrolase [Vagococcus hydrophili]|uniref:Alpha/beta hydrolase n=1 Tax=Vagococcus hydrophili TaxID=2714947 RepID=A0A6G8ASY8_9ENTE|nr:alpha/beta hydrolase [Vagococcus hydrophili]QIL48107.1 alpha/beta hydrolase [Vagococcus hydrophili]
MEHIIKQGKNHEPILVLLHGTGGNEQSLLDVGNGLNEQATLIGVRGNVLENDYPRFFKRLQEGMFDEEDLEERAIELHEWLQETLEKNNYDKEQVVLVGYSNGANIGVRLLLDYPNFYQKAILFHPMYPVVVDDKQDLSQTQIFMTMGEKDPIVSMFESYRVAEMLKDRGAHIIEEWTLSHQLTYLEVERAKEWLNKKEW